MMMWTGRISMATSPPVAFRRMTSTMMMTMTRMSSSRSSSSRRTFLMISSSSQSFPVTRGSISFSTATDHLYSTSPNRFVASRHFSSSSSPQGHPPSLQPEVSISHADFGPQTRTAPQAAKEEEDAELQEALTLIQQHVQDHPIMLYMKGSPRQPQCGFSARVVQILQQEGVDFASVNVLDYPHIRNAIKVYSDWPTIPQLFVQGEFIGGCDILTAMHQSGELNTLLAPLKNAESKSF